jgi:hypothetical protein
MELTIVVPRRSWLEISLWKLGKAGRKKEKQRKEAKKRSKEKKRVSKQPSLTAEIR